ncbi:hypothetical protein F444_13926 [Phytophthora nicotianae P1976]|uniref:Uncharacterized protein n=1 Tax=Phytophthora nicotianae P1976 TaxID=1317066 RepID=A0A080ZS69_PHYNI|nr:hypothetical protein F444_13926 [Phytophthora nicotianae P1976]
MTVVNGYIVRCLTVKKREEKPPTHADYLRRLHAQLLPLWEINFETHPNAEDLVNVPILSQEHLLTWGDIKSISSSRKKKNRLCKRKEDSDEEQIIQGLEGLEGLEGLLRERFK